MINRVPLIEEVILAEERTTEEERMHIMEGLYEVSLWFFCLPVSFVVELQS
jgi:hypothetical protein